MVATPGRFIEMVRSKATSLLRCTMLILDEADRMFEMGFEYQMRSIASNIRPDRQLLMFSATMKKKVEGFAREMMKNEIRIVVGKISCMYIYVYICEYLHCDHSTEYFCVTYACSAVIDLSRVRHYWTSES